MCVCVRPCIHACVYMLCELIPVHQILEIYRLGSYGCPLGSCRIHIAEYSFLCDRHHPKGKMKMEEAETLL